MVEMLRRESQVFAGFISSMRPTLQADSDSRVYLVSGIRVPSHAHAGVPSSDTSRWTREGSYLLCRTRPSTAPHEAAHRGPVPQAWVTVQSLGAHYSSPPGLLKVARRSGRCL